MEDTLRAPNGQTFEINPEVLILVLMKDTLRDMRCDGEHTAKMS